MTAYTTKEEYCGPCEVLVCHDEGHIPFSIPDSK